MMDYRLPETLEPIRELIGIPQSSDSPARRRQLLRRFFGWVVLGVGLFVVLVGFYFYHEANKHVRLSNFLEAASAGVPFAQSQAAASAASWGHRRNEAYVVLGGGAVVAVVGLAVLYSTTRGTGDRPDPESGQD